MGVLWMLCTVWTVPSSQVKCRTCPGRNWNWRPLNSKAVSLTLESQHGTSFEVWNFWVSAFHILKFILHSVSISLQHRNFAIQYRKQKLIYMSIAWIIWIVWLTRGNPWSGKTPKASELFPVAIPQSSCQAESGNKIMVSKHHPHALGIPWPCKWNPWPCKWNSSSKASKAPKKASKAPKVPNFKESRLKVSWNSMRKWEVSQTTQGAAASPADLGLEALLRHLAVPGKTMLAAQVVPKIESVNPRTPSKNKVNKKHRINSSQRNIMQYPCATRFLNSITWLH